MNRKTTKQKAVTNHSSKYFDAKLKTELEAIMGQNGIKNLIDKEILYWVKDDHDSGYAEWAKILDISPNGKFVKLVDCKPDDDAPYYRSIELIEIVDVLS